MNLLDWLLVVLVLAYALSGYWQGFVTGAFATAGLLLGGLFGVWLAPIALGDADPSLLVSLGALFIVILAASLGQALLQFAGARIRDRITWQPIRALDAVGGAVLSAAAVLVVAWALGRRDRRRRPRRDHADGARLDGARPRSTACCPARPSGVLGAFNNVVGTSFFPRYLEPFAPERIVEVGPGPKRLLTDPDVEAAAASVLKIRGTNQCGRGRRGLRLRLLRRPGDDQRPRRRRGRRPRGRDRRQLGLGRGRLLQPRPRRRGARGRHVRRCPTLAFDQTAEAEDGVAILGYPQDGPYDVQPGRIRSEQRLRSPNIYGEGTVIREVFSLRGLVRPGNSGGPIVSSARRRGRRGVRRVGDRPRHRLRADRRAGRDAAPRSASPATTRCRPATAPAERLVRVSSCRAAPSGSPCPGGSPPRARGPA